MSDYYAQRRAASRAMYPRITDNRTAAATHNPQAREGYTVRQSHGGGWVVDVNSGVIVEYHDTLAAALAAVQRIHRAMGGTHE
jgi:hypothetical protein